jgi:tetratricopeptide (TPR) repeat protein
MIQSGVFSDEQLKNLMMRVFRLFCVFCVISLFQAKASAETAQKDTVAQERAEINKDKIEALDLAKSYKSKDYESIVEHLKGAKHVLTAKERMFQALAYGKMGRLDLKIQALKEAANQHSTVDMFKRELAAAIELKADSYADTTNYSKIKDKYYAESAQILNELYNKKSSPVNFSALIQYYNRRELYDETVGLLEVYGRGKDKGKIFYTYMCEAQFKASLYTGALKSCGKLIEIRPDYPEGHIIHSKTIAYLGEKELADKTMVKLASRFPASAPVQFEAGKVLIENGNAVKGLKHLEKHLSVDATDEALVLKADTQFKRGNEKEALKTFIQACKQHKEPRKPLLDVMKSSARKLASSNELKDKYDMELSRCKYTYRPDKIAPKGILGGEFKTRD